MLAAPLCLFASDPGPTGERASDPYRVTSPSGRQFIEVVPSRRDGSGPCRVLIGRDCAFFADEELPRTLRDAVLDDAGDIAGWCSADRFDGNQPELFLCVRGGLFRACPLPDSVQPELCRGLGLVLQHEHARALLRLDRYVDGRRREEWWPIGLPGGEWGAPILPERLRPPGPAWDPQAFFQLQPIGVHDALLATSWPFTLYDADGRALWSLFERSAAFQPESDAIPVDTLGPLPGGFTLRVACFRKDDEWESHEERLFRTQPDCADLCVTEVARFWHPDVPMEAVPACREIALEPVGEPRAVARPPGGDHEKFGLGPRDEVIGSATGPRAATLASGRRVWCDERGKVAWIAKGDDPKGEREIEFARRIDDKWLGWIQEVAPLDDGGLALLDRAWGWRGENFARLVLFSPHGEPLEQYALPAWSLREVHARGDWICVRSQFPSAVILVRRSTREVFRARLGKDYDAQHPLLPAGAPELWLFDAQRSTLARYRLPGA